MRTTIAGFVFAVNLLLASSASAQALGGETMVSNVNAEASVFVAVPGEDIADFVETSPGIRIGAGYHLNSHLSAHASARYIVIRTKDDLLDNGDVTYFDIGVGGRFTQALTPTLAVAGDLEVVMSQVRVQLPVIDDTDRDPGVAVRFNAFYALGPKFHLSASVGVTKNFATGDDTDQDSRWLDAGVGALLFF